MTDLLFVSVWILLSWLIRQIESGGIGNSDNESGGQGEGNEIESKAPGAGEQEEQQLGIGPTQFEPYEPITQAIKIAITAFSLLLVGLSISAYRKTRIKRLVYAAVAFGLFALQLFFDYLGDAIPAFDTPYMDIILYGITLAILVLFFTAIVRKR